MILDALNDALVKLQLPPEKVVMVTDIGCIGLADRHFTTSAFHGLHGRSITYACGMKLARPDLHVITLMGDGGCGIGGTHLLNVCRRNIGITLIVANNFNYGMTGGQHSVSTPVGGSTVSTPLGNVERPLDISGTAAAAGASWVRRTTSFEKDLSDCMVEAIRQEGFSLLEIWELCTAYYAPRNKVKKTALYEMLEPSGFTLGMVADNPAPEYSAGFHQALEQSGGIKPRGKSVINRGFSSKLQKQTGVLIAGGAGQKVRSSAGIFACSAISAGLHATQKDDYPITVKTGHSVSELIISPHPIDFTGIDPPDYTLLLSPEGLKRTRDRIARLPDDAVVLAEETLELPETRAVVLRAPFQSKAKSIDRHGLTLVALGALLRKSGIFPLAAAEAYIRDIRGQGMMEKNISALNAGAELVDIS